MPLEIKELHIKITVDNGDGGAAGGQGGGSSGGGNTAGEPDENTVAACVEKVLEILADKTER